MIYVALMEQLTNWPDRWPYARGETIVKIGHTTNPYVRLSCLKSKWGTARYLVVKDGNKEDEKALHDEFKKMRIKSWSAKTDLFRMPQEMVDALVKRLADNGD